MAVAFRMRQERDGHWRAVAEGHAIEVSGKDLRDCLREVHHHVLEMLPAVSWEDGPPVVFLEVVPRLVGVAEAAELLGWDKRRVATYVKRGSFPEPVESLAGGRVWKLDDIQAFASAFRARQSRRRNGSRRAGPD